jgi:hypothetical protein
MEECVTETIDELCLKLGEEVEAYLFESGRRERSLQYKSQTGLQSSVSILVRDALIAHVTHPYAPVPISKRPGTYSCSHIEYRGVSFRMHVETVYPALQAMGYVQLVKKGYLDRTKGKGKREVYAATDKLIDFFKFDQQTDTWFSNDTPATRLTVSNQSIPSTRPVVVSTKIKSSNDSGQKVFFKNVHIAPESKAHRAIRKRVKQLNEYLKRYWIDLNLSPQQWAEMSRGWKDKNGDYHTLNLTKRSLYRVFHDDKLKTGGRFYGGWWQEIPSKFRQNIIVNGKETVECDFSGLHPSILYAMEKHPIPADPYGPIAGPEHRDIIKRCFNAMLNSKSRTTRAPKEIDISPTGMRWSEIVDQIEQFHAPIKHQFFTSAGMWLMREDSELAEKIMMDYFEYNQFCLPVHDSFIVHFSWEQDLQDRMIDVFLQRYGVKPKIKVTKRPKSVDTSLRLIEPGEITVNEIIEAGNEPHYLRNELFKLLNSPKPRGGAHQLQGP